MTKIIIGTRVRVKDNAFEGSDNPDDFTFRGKLGEVVFILGKHGEVEVQTEDDDFLLLTIDEIEVIEAQPKGEEADAIN